MIGVYSIRGNNMLQVVFNRVKDKSETVYVNPIQVVLARYTGNGFYVVKMTNGELLLLDESDFNRVSKN